MTDDHRTCCVKEGGSRCGRPSETFYVGKGAWAEQALRPFGRCAAHPMDAALDDYVFREVQENEAIAQGALLQVHQC